MDENNENNVEEVKEEKVTENTANEIKEENNIKNENIKEEKVQNEAVKEEKKSENNFNISSDDFKKETADTVNEVKNTIKNADFKKDSAEAKGFISSFFKNPLGTLKKVTEGGNKFVKIAIIVLIVWLVAILLINIVSVAKTYLFGPYGSFEYFFKHFFSNILNLLKALVAPIVSVALLSGLVYGFKKNKNKSFLSIACSIIITQIPVVAATVVSLLTIIGPAISRITSAFSGFCNILSTVLLYFAIKDLSDEEHNDSYFWKFAIIMGIFYVVKFVFSYLGIYL